MANSRRALEEAFETGSAALASMAGQRDRLKARVCCACPGLSKTAWRAWCCAFNQTW